MTNFDRNLHTELPHLQRKMVSHRTYSLFVRDMNTTKWVRLTSLALRLDRARVVFQSRLLDGTFNGFEMALRPAAEDMANAATYSANMQRFFPATEVTK